MADLHLVTGYKGEPHITSANQGLFNANTIGSGDYVFNSGNKFESSILNSNNVRIYDGSLMMNGRHITLDAGTYVDAVIENGTSGSKRHDIIVVRYEKAAATGIESAKLVVIKGTPSTGTPTDPSISYTDSILDSAAQHDMPLYRVILDNFTITKVEPLFQLLAPMADFQHDFYKQNMLINGDFQCNQRGETTWEVGNTVQYSLDMWRIFQINMQLHDNGLKVARYSEDVQGYSTQFVKVDELAEKYTLSLRADGKVYSFTTAVGTQTVEKEFDKFKIGIVYVSATKHIKVNFCPLTTGYVTVKYIDLFEGGIAYPHKKEDPATAMMRCERYIYKGTYFSPILNVTKDSAANTSRFIFGLPIHNMVDTPVLEEGDWYLNGYGAPGTQTGGNAKTLTSYSMTGREWQLQTPAWQISPYEGVTGIRIRYTLSCEPHPNGD